MHYLLCLWFRYPEDVQRMKDVVIDEALMDIKDKDKETRTAFSTWTVEEYISE